MESKFVRPYMSSVVVVGVCGLLAGCPPGSRGGGNATSAGTIRDRIVFEREAAANRFDIYLLQANGAGETRVFGTTAQESEPAWSRGNGTSEPPRIYFATDQSGNNDIHWVREDGTGEQIPNAAPAQDRVPAYSSNDKVAFARERNGGFDIMTMGNDGGSLQLLTDNSCPDSEPAWSPDGTMIAYTTTAHTSVREEVSCNESFDIWVMDQLGANPRRLTNTTDRNEVDPSWSPDGSRIVFESTMLNGSGADLMIMNADGSGVRNLTNTSAIDETDPIFSSDGTEIIFAQSVTGANGSVIAAMPVSGGAARVLTPPGVVGRAPALANVR